MTAAATATHDLLPVEHPLLIWLHHISDHFDRIYVRRQDRKTGRWQSTRLANVPVGESFEWMAHWARLGHLPVAVQGEPLPVAVHPALIWLDYLIAHFGCIHVAYNEDGRERDVPLSELPIEEAFYWIAAWASGRR